MKARTMKRFAWLAVALLLTVMIGVSLASESSTETYIKDLKSDNPEVRAKAAYELGCG
jgi:hypothetical protein